MVKYDQEQRPQNIVQKITELARQSSFRASVSDCILGLSKPDSIKDTTSTRLLWMRTMLKMHGASMGQQETIQFQRDVYSMLLSKTLLDLQKPGLLQDLLLSRLGTSQTERLHVLRQLFPKNNISLTEDSSNKGGYSLEGLADENSNNLGIVEKDNEGTLSIKMASRGLEDADEIEHELISLYSIKSAIESLPEETQKEVVKKPLSEIRENEILLQSGIIVSIVEVILDMLSYQLSS